MYLYLYLNLYPYICHLSQFWIVANKTCTKFAKESLHVCLWACDVLRLVWPLAEALHHEVATLLRRSAGVPDWRTLLGPRVLAYDFVIHLL